MEEKIEALRRGVIQQVQFLALDDIVKQSHLDEMEGYEELINLKQECQTQIEKLLEDESEV